MKRLLLLALLVAPVTFQSCKWIQKKRGRTDEQEMQLLHLKRMDSLKSDSIKSLQAELAFIKSTHQQLLDSIKKTGMTGTTGYKFHVIVGSFKNPQNVTSYKQYVQDKGFHPRVLKNEYGFQLVAAESFNNWRQAVGTLRELRENFEPNSWIYIEN